MVEGERERERERNKSAHLWGRLKNDAVMHIRQTHLRNNARRSDGNPSFLSTTADSRGPSYARHTPVTVFGVNLFPPRMTVAAATSSTTTTTTRVF